MTELQALVTGMLLGAIVKPPQLDITVTPLYDAERNYLPEFLVIGNQSGQQVRVSIEALNA